MDNALVVSKTELLTSTTVVRQQITQSAPFGGTNDRKHINGVKLPTEEFRRNRLSRQCGKNIAAIDFGTTSCSVAYCIDEDRKVRALRFSDDVRFPSVILMDADGRVVEFGKNARKKYAHLPPDKKQHHHLFTEIKMNLQHDKVNNTIILMRYS